MARIVSPECRYGHGPLNLSIPPLDHGVDPKTKAWYFVPSFSQGHVNLGVGYTCEIWQCVKCSYMEFHDINIRNE
jgi:hypothetical protein